MSKIKSQDKEMGKLKFKKVINVPKYNRKFKLKILNKS
jgi:hypothetical protein